MKEKKLRYLNTEETRKTKRNDVKKELRYIT